MTRDGGSREHRTGDICPACEGEITVGTGLRPDELYLDCDCGSAVVLGSITSTLVHAA